MLITVIHSTGTAIYKDARAEVWAGGTLAIIHRDGTKLYAPHQWRETDIKREAFTNAMYTKPAEVVHNLLTGE